MYREFWFISLGLVAISCSLSMAATGKANLKGTTEGSDIKGEVKLEDSPLGLKIEADLVNVPAGQHAFHIHEFGDCSDTGNAAGSHYNPKNTIHGDVLKNGMSKAHAGDFGNVTIDDKGMGHFSAVVKGLKLKDGSNTVVGRAFVLHANPDDFGQPTGNAGGRIACGPIVLTKPN